VDLFLLLFTPDITQLERAARGGSDLRLFAVHTVSDDLRKGNKTGHLPALCHLDGALPAPDCSRRRTLSSGFCIIAELADSTKFIQPPPITNFLRYYSIPYGQAGEKEN
jgi:hypothetical protein